jgi:hypothetical protein
MARLDGNAIAGTLVDVFGEEMTIATGTCAQCRQATRLGEAIVYLPLPGIIARCPNCDHILMVIVDRRGTFCVDMTGLANVDTTQSDTPPHFQQ